MSGYTDEVAIETHDVMEQANIAEEKMLNESERKQKQQQNQKKGKDLSGQSSGQQKSSGSMVDKAKEALNMK